LISNRADLQSRGFQFRKDQYTKTNGRKQVAWKELAESSSD